MKKLILAVILTLLGFVFVRISITEDFVMVKIHRLIVFTYIEPINLIGYLIHRRDTKQFTGHGWNPYTGKISTLKA